MAFVNLKSEPVDVSGMKPVSVAGSPVPPQAPLENDPNPYLRTTVPLTFQYQPDTLRQVPAKGFTQFRTPVIPLNANPAVNASAQTVANNTTTTVVSSSGNLNDRGVWNAHTAYAVDDVVLFNESAYVAIVANTNIQPDPVTSASTWQLLSENLVFNADPVTTITGGFGPFDKSGTNASVMSTTPTSATLTPTYPGEMALFVVGFTGGISVPSGWYNLGDPFVGSLNFFAQRQATTAPFTATATTSNEAWTTTLALFPYGRNTTANITAITVVSNVATITCAKPNFLPGTLAFFSGVTNATWLNGNSYTVLASTPTGFTCTVSHVNSGPAADTGTATDVGLVQSAFSVPGNVSSDTINFTNPVTADNTVVVAQTGYNAGGFPSGYANITSLAGITAPGGWSISNTESSGINLPHSNLAYIQNVTSGSSVTVGVAQSLVGATIAIFEFTAGAITTQYLPFDVVVFSGAEWVCLTATTDPPTVTPANWYSLGSGGNFASISTGTNTTATMTVGSGATLTFSGTGVVNASELEGDTWEAPGTIGSTTPNTGVFSTLTATTYHDLPYDISMFTPGVFLAGQELVAMPIAGCTFPSGLGGSIATLLVPSTGTLTFAIQHNGTTFGTITFTASATGVVTSSAAQTFTSGDVFSVIVTGSPDPTASTLSLFIPTTRT